MRQRIEDRAREAIRGISAAHEFRTQRPRRGKRVMNQADTALRRESVLRPCLQLVNVIMRHQNAEGPVHRKTRDAGNLRRSFMKLNLALTSPSATSPITREDRANSSQPSFITGTMGAGDSRRRTSIAASTISERPSPSAP